MDAVLVTPGSDLQYLVGYDAIPLERLTCLIIPADGPASIVVPRLERLAAVASPIGALGIEVQAWDETDDPSALVASLASGALRVGLDNHMWAEKVLRLRDAMPNVEQVLAGEVISTLRMRKDDAEIVALLAAGAAIDRVHERVASLLRPGRTEREVAGDIADAILVEGHVRVDFVIVASGPNGASPHHEVSDRVIERGDAVVVDIGGTMPDGYRSDCTRTYAVGHVPAGFAERYNVLRAAQAAAVDWARAGVTCESVDAAARDLMDSAGIADLFIHRTGHGIGLDTHEDPYIVTGNTLELEQGMAFSIEPGFYCEGEQHQPRPGRGLMSYAWKGASVTRLLPTEESVDLLALTEEVAAREIAPLASDAEETATFPRELFRTLGGLGYLGLPFDSEYGGGEQPYEVTLQVMEELSRAWMSIGVSVSVHYLSCFGLANFGTVEQRAKWLPDMIGGQLLGAYCLSESHSGSDASALATRAVLDGDDYVVNGTKSWITHGGIADFYSAMVRTSDDGPKGISCLLVPGDLAGVSSAQPEHKMGANASPTAQVIFEGARVPADRLLGAEGGGFTVALAALDAGRLGIAACAVGLAQNALDAAVAYAADRKQFGKSIIEFQGVSFMLADMATAIAAARALYVDAARLKDAGLPFGMQAAMAKLAATDAAMKVTTDAIQVLGGAGYTKDFPVERYFREAKALQIVEGTNQIQRMVIGRALRSERSEPRKSASMDSGRALHSRAAK